MNKGKEFLSFERSVDCFAVENQTRLPRQRLLVSQFLTYYRIK